MRRASRRAVIVGVVGASLTLPAGVLAAPADGGMVSSATWSFVSAPNLHPPRVQVRARTAGLAPGDFLAATAGAGRPGSPEGQSGPLLMDSRTRPVWFLPDPGQPFNLQQQTYEGKPVLTWFDGGGVIAVRHGHRPPKRPPPSRNPGEVVIYNEQYRQIAAIKSRSPWMTDLHDSSIIGGNIWITVTRVVQHVNLAPYGGHGYGSVLDVGLQEFQISTGHLLRTWDALNPGGKPNVPLSDSEERVSSGWDAYHLNSVQALPGGDLLVSMRNTWAVYLIDPVTDRVIWTLGGKHSSFALGPGVSFSWQHDARLVNPAQEGQGPQVELTLFNDHNGDNRNSPSKPSEGMVLSLSTVDRRATLLHAYRHNPPLSAQILGSMQLLPNGNALVGWGSEPYFSEYSKSGRVLLDARWPAPSASYRTLFTDTWIGKPYYPPSGAVRSKTVYASWNGATQVARWEVLAGPDKSHLKVVATRAHTGFETAIKLARSYAAYEVRALSTSGQALGTSTAFS